MTTPALSGSGSKEVEPAGVREVGKEVEVPAETASTGAPVQPKTTNVPPTVPQTAAPTVSQQTPQAMRNVPLTDDQIAQGLTQSITSSWLWLAQWCIRKLKQLKAWRA